MDLGGPRGIRLVHVGLTFRLPLKQAIHCQQLGAYGCRDCRVPMDSGGPRGIRLVYVGLTFRLLLKQSIGSHQPGDWDSRDSMDPGRLRVLRGRLDSIVLVRPSGCPLINQLAATSQATGTAGIPWIPWIEGAQREAGLDCVG